MTGYGRDRIDKALKQGKLFVHMFEFPTDNGHGYNDREPANFRKLFDVMSKKSGAHYDNDYHRVVACEDGYRGMAATALKKGLPVKLWNAESDFGIILDGTNKKHLSPLFIGSSDLNSSVRINDVTYEHPNIFSNLARMQGMDINTDGIVMARSFKFPEDLPELKANAAKALPVFWREVEKMGWDAYLKTQPICKGVNEMTIAADVGAVAGLVVYEDRQKIGGFGETKDDVYAQSVHDAKHLRDWLCKTYPDEFPKPLPIMSYNPSRIQMPMMELTEHQIAHPEEIKIPESTRQRRSAPPPSQGDLNEHLFTLLFSDKGPIKRGRG